MPLMRPRGMTAFTIVWFGQLISLMGTSMSGFAITIWAWQFTGSATALAIVGFFSFAPRIIFSPIAGALVDRWNRKLVMMISDIASGLMTIVILLLYSSGQLQVWHLAATGFISSAFQAFQWPAYSAAITLMIPKEQYTRASGMMGLAEYGAGVFAPVLAGALIAVIGLNGILTIDIVTFIFAVLALLIIVVPQPKQTEEGKAAQTGLVSESVFGFKYIWKRKSLLGLQLVFFGGNLLSSFGYTILAPMLLSRTNNNTLLFGTVESAASIGGIVGGILISTWGGPKRRVYGVLFGWLLTGVLGQALFGLGQTLPVWLIAAFLATFFGPIINSSNQAIWQAKVPPDIQGKVFSARLMIAQISAPLATLMAGPLADQLFEPALKTPQSAWAGTFGWLVGTGPGAGMSLMMVFSGLAIIFVAVAGLLNPLIRNAETLLPDHKAEIVES